MLSPVGGLGACPQKRINFALKVCNSEQVLVLLSYITAESGGLSPSPKSGDLSPCPPTPTPMLIDQVLPVLPRVRVKTK